MQQQQQQQQNQQQHIQSHQQQQHSPSKSESHIVSVMGDSVIQVVKADQISKHHVQHLQQHNSVVTSVATASSTTVQQRPTINFVDNHNGTKTITLPVNVSQSPLKMTSGNTMVLPVSMEGLQSLVQAGASVQIVQQNEVDGSTRLQSYRYVQLPTSQGPATVALVPSSDPRFTFVDQSQVRASSVSSMPEDEQHEVIAVHPNETEDDEEEDEMQYVQFSGYNNKEDNRDERNMSNISEFLKIKTLVESPPHSSQEEPMDDVEGESVARCSCQMRK
uniref:Uncharacterized protein n=1 Tax=Cacopsylla melanoneura TaxID=428564 RepID=A0A8D9BQF0_9HEMI